MVAKSGLASRSLQFDSLIDARGQQPLVWIFSLFPTLQLQLGSRAEIESWTGLTAFLPVRLW